MCSNVINLISSKYYLQVSNFYHSAGDEAVAVAYGGFTRLLMVLKKVLGL